MSRSVLNLKEEVVELEAELANLAKTQAEMDKIRAEESANFQVAKADLTQGLGGVRKALSVLRDYYGGAAALLQESTHSPLVRLHLQVEQGREVLYHALA